MSEKQFYTIGAVCDETGLAHSTLRFWEKQFTFLKPNRRSGGHRYYTHEQLQKILYIKKLLHQDGFTIEGAKKKIAQDKKNGQLTFDLATDNDITPLEETTVDVSTVKTTSQPIENKENIIKELKEILDILNK